jgi:hypothetical protein
MKSLISAAHAAGYAMAGEELPEAAPVVIMHKRPGTALAVRPSNYPPYLVRRMQRSLVRLWLREWVFAHGARRAAA